MRKDISEATLIMKYLNSVNVVPHYIGLDPVEGVCCIPLGRPLP
jgi:hypothetical protein